MTWRSFRHLLEYLTIRLPWLKARATITKVEPYAAVTKKTSLLAALTFKYQYYGVVGYVLLPHTHLLYKYRPYATVVLKASEL